MTARISTTIYILIMILTINANVNSQSLDSIGSCVMPHAAWAVQVVGNYAYVADDSSGLQIVDLSDPASPAVVSSYDTPNRAIDICVSGQYAYIADFNSLQIIDISNPLSPTLAGSHPTFRTIAVDVAGDYAYLAGEYTAPTVKIVNIADPSSPESTSAISFSGGAFSLDYSNGYLAVLSNVTEPYSNYLRIIDVTDPQNPHISGSVRIPGEIEIPKDVKISGDYAYIADGGNGLQIVNISDPANPAVVGAYDSPGAAWGVTVNGSYAYLAEQNYGVEMISVYDPTNPLFLAYAQTNFPILNVFATEAYVFATGSGWLEILQPTFTGNVESPIHLPVAVSLTQNYPNPFNPSTSIQYDLINDSPVNISIYNLLGQKIETLVNKIQHAGHHQIIWNAKDVSSGIYFYKINAGEYTETKKMVLLK